MLSRNIKSLEQLRTLFQDIKKISKDDKFPILNDVEGGKVSRLKRIIDDGVLDPKISWWEDGLNEMGDND